MLNGLAIFISAIGANKDECPVLTNGLVVTKYYIDGCGACQRLAPEVARIVSRLEEMKSNVKYREVECNECVCEGITSFPTLVVTDNKKEKAKSIGFKTFDKIIKWLGPLININPKALLGDNKSVEKLSDVADSVTMADSAVADVKQHVVKELTARDFLSGFEGQWLILFYDSASDPNRAFFKELAKKFGNRLNIAEVAKHEAARVTNRFNITTYPRIIALNHGNTVPYAGATELPEMIRFASRLARPSFESITYKELLAKSKKVTFGEPIYVVLYKDYELASHYYNDLAQQFKFKAAIYKSNDPALFEAAGLHPKDYSDFEKQKEAESDAGSSKADEYKEKKTEYHDVDHNQMLKLVVYKNNTFFASHIPLEDNNGIVQWIFHTHFAYVTNITNENFYTVFHGIKPVMILLTANERYLDDFNRFSADRHLGTPYTNTLLATLDVGEYPLFKQQVLPRLQTPAFAFYDPVRVKWYSSNTPIGNISHAEFAHEAMRVLELYGANLLPEYPPKQKRGWSLYIVAAWVVLLIAFFCFRSVADRYKVD